MERVLSSAPCVRVTLFHSPGDFYVIRTEDGGKLERIQRWADIDVSNDRYGPEPHHRLQEPLRQTPLPSDQGDDEDAQPGNPEAEEEALGLDDYVRRLTLEYPGLQMGSWVLARCRSLGLQPPAPLHRAQIIEVYFNPVLGPHLKLHFIDYGFEEWVMMSGVRMMPEKYYDIPRLAKHCRLHRCYPNYNPEDCDEDGWSAKAKEEFVRLIREASRLELHVIEQGPAPATLGVAVDCDLLFSTPDNGQQSVRDMLLYQHLVCLADPKTLPPPLDIPDLPPLPDYKQLDLIGDSGSCTLVRLSYVVDSGELYVQPATFTGPRKPDILGQMQERLDRFYGNKDNQHMFEVTYPIAGALCAVRLPRIRGCPYRFRRCKVESVPARTRLAQIWMVDTGEREVVGAKDLFYLNEDVFLQRYPYAFCVPVSLDNLTPACSLTGWCQQAKDHLQALVGNELLMYVCPGGRVESDSGFRRDEPADAESRLSVALFHRDSRTCINSELIDRRLAQPTKLMEAAKESAVYPNEKDSEPPFLWTCSAAVGTCRHPEGVSQSELLLHLANRDTF
jgi:hypothetical protein